LGSRGRATAGGAALLLQPCFFGRRGAFTADNSGEHHGSGNYLAKGEFSRKAALTTKLELSEFQRGELPPRGSPSGGGPIQPGSRGAHFFVERFRTAAFSGPTRLTRSLTSRLGLLGSLLGRPGLGREYRRPPLKRGSPGEICDSFHRFLSVGAELTRWLKSVSTVIRRQLSLVGRFPKNSNYKNSSRSSGGTKRFSEGIPSSWATLSVKELDDVPNGGPQT